MNVQQSVNPPQDYFDEFTGESDRASAIVGAAWLDEILAKLLKNFLIKDTVSSRLLGESGHGPLSTFANRVNVSYSLGLLTKEERLNLLSVGKIRNLFAHRIQRSSFSNQKMARETEKLTIGKRWTGRAEETTPRDLFTATVASLAYTLGIKCEEVKAERRQDNRK